ncbi:MULTISPECIES: type III PLP-dependent enzyme [unclassified Hydrogenobaculum]|uniref:type III PLP-dependent enzyme n=1 Tax=unclassified Hydrogenobaculum TaxID=2622382 RepID=UPI0001C51EC4|nr:MULTISPECIES: type III PLP-dependent enzyme [unclassified Hydrogenobaculum]AEF19853.1 Ornithine decarboxylase [Hydrogenobaculum sp. 3684]AEG47139.1 Ornithine decarboxylase [Hydrogenobaculum sp. SHO]AGG15787.1 Ornithine decarboxylase [Hydrogenobaculum sp. HO]AGH94087.1 diaminopimelate decarboxylase [Hydrogenobaculum sp. SN]
MPEKVLEAEEVPDVYPLQYKFAKQYFDSIVLRKPFILDVLKSVKTPTLVINLDRIKERFIELQEALKEAKIYYAVKANDHQEILALLNYLGSGYEVASSWELEKVLRLGVDGSRIISSNPVKPLDFIDYAYKSGIKAFSIDSYKEIDKLKKIAPRSRVYVRLIVPNEGSDWPLTNKFGVDVDTALDILEYAKYQGLVPYGITFHVGSQCNNLRNWFIGIKKAWELWEKAIYKDIKLTMLNLGGGIPVNYQYESLSIRDIGSYIEALLQKYFLIKPMEIQIEPGRGLVGDAGVLVSSVIGKTTKYINGEESYWIYLDTGVFNGLAEVLGGISYPMYAEQKGEIKPYTIAGVSCDSMDIISNFTYLPDVDVGDRIYIMATGAYTTVYAANFNGFGIPETVFV